MVILTANEIDNCCLDIIQFIDDNYNMYSSHIRFMYLYGCRIGELFDNRISFDGNTSTVYIVAQKGNYVRENNLVTNLVPALIENINLTQDNFWINKRNLQRIIEKASPYRVLYCGKKRIGAHLFRHNWVKKQVASGKQINSIDRELGYTLQSIIDTYLPSVIYY